MSDVAPTGLDAHKPAVIAQMIRQSGVLKAQMQLVPLMTLSVLGGLFIAMGALFYTQITAGYDELTGGLKLMAGVAFSLGLILVAVGGAELFTGNTMIVMAYVDRRINLTMLLRNWVIVLVGNAAGSFLALALVSAGGLLDGDHGARAVAISEVKLSLSPLEAFTRGILCNALVCLAVWLSVSARTAMGMIMSIVWPVAAFVAIGLEHSIANLYLIPAGMLVSGGLSVTDLMGNFIPVVLGNIIGGAGGVALSYRLAYRGQLALEGI